MIATDPRPSTGLPETSAFDYGRALLNILEDSDSEKEHLRGAQRAVLNILDDLGVERDRLEEAQSELIKSEQAVRLSLREKETLLKEIHHRVKNNLQVIASLLRLQSRYLPDGQVREMFEESQNRVHSISLVHEMLYQTGNLAKVKVSDYLDTLSRHLADGWKGRAASINIVVDVSGVELAADTAIPCGLIVNELVTNALKHAFPNATSGEIRVSAVETPDGWFKLTVRDNGVGLPQEVDVKRSGSLGLELVATLVRQLRARVEIQREAGTTFEILFQVASR